MRSRACAARGRDLARCMPGGSEPAGRALWAAMNAAVVRRTQESLGRVIRKPPLTDRLLCKPPFRYLHDVIGEVGLFAPSSRPRCQVPRGAGPRGCSGRAPPPAGLGPCKGLGLGASPLPPAWQPARSAARGGQQSRRTAEDGPGRCGATLWLPPTTALKPGTARGRLSSSLESRVLHQLVLWPPSHPFTCRFPPHKLLQGRSHSAPSFPPPPTSVLPDNGAPALTWKCRAPSLKEMLDIRISSFFLFPPEKERKKETW